MIRLVDPQLRHICDLTPCEVEGYLQAHTLAGRALGWDRATLVVFPTQLLPEIERIERRVLPLIRTASSWDDLVVRVRHRLQECERVVFMPSLQTLHRPLGLFSPSQFPSAIAARVAPKLTDAEIYLPAGVYGTNCICGFERQQRDDGAACAAPDFPET